MIKPTSCAVKLAWIVMILSDAVQPIVAAPATLPGRPNGKVTRAFAMLALPTAESAFAESCSTHKVLADARLGLHTVEMCRG